jgi:hypothetical protein
MAGLCAVSLLLCLQSANTQAPMARYEAQALALEVAGDSTVRLGLGEGLGGAVRENSAQPLGSVTIAGVDHPSTSAEQDGDLLRLTYGDTGVTVTLRVERKPRYVSLAVTEVEGPAIERLAILDIALTPRAGQDGACALALNLQTDVPELPGPCDRLRAYCYPRFGLAGASVAIVAGTPDTMREAMKDVVREAPGIPASTVGGPWALEGPLNRSSYVFNFGGLSEATVDQWIAQAKSIGFDQIQFHGGSSFRFGDCALDAATYPNGFESLRAVIDKLHAAGIKAGMQPYAFFLDKRSQWVTPVPDPRLAKDVTLTLAEDLPVDVTTVPVVEPTTDMSTITGFFVHNSVTLEIDDELIVYSAISKEPPYAFTQCQRGALGTTAAPHAKGAPVAHLKECFGLFVPDPETTLFAEVAAKTAELANRCGFDAIYLDALDGEAILGGAENAWHYGSAYAFEIARRLERPTLMEMSTFHHHLWYLRSRMGAWDHPNRCHKQFIDLHLAANESNARMFLPSNLGWWAFKSWAGPQVEPTFADDIEYLCAKALGTDSGLSLVSYDPASPGHQRLAEILKRWETLRHAGTVPESMKARLREPGAEFTLEETPRGPAFVPVSYVKHTTDLRDGSASWETANPFSAQPAGLRIEALSSVGPYDDPANTTVVDFADPALLSDRAAAPGVAVSLEASTEQLAPGSTVSGLLRATSSLPDRRGSWAKLGRVFTPPLNLSAQQGLGVWVYGDGKGELLNLQLRCPSHVVAGLGEHYITVDFVGWRYFALVEPDADQWAAHAWPYGNVYSIYREGIEYGAIEELSVWVNDLPPGEEVSLFLGPIKALPLEDASLVNPSISVGGSTVTFPTTLATGAYLEYAPGGTARAYGPDGALLAEVRPVGDALPLAAGANTVGVSCEPQAGPAPRARVTVIARGERVG